MIYCFRRTSLSLSPSSPPSLSCSSGSVCTSPPIRFLDLVLSKQSPPVRGSCLTPETHQLLCFWNIGVTGVMCRSNFFPLLHAHVLVRVHADVHVQLLVLDLHFLLDSCITIRWSSFFSWSCPSHVFDPFHLPHSLNVDEFCSRMMEMRLSPSNGCWLFPWGST